KLSYPAGHFTGDTGVIQAKLKNVSGAIYYPALAPEDGTHYNAISSANAYTISLNGSSTTTLKVQTLTGIPDRCFDKTTLECVGYGENVKEHNFVYLPITGPDGRVWLNNNLGADYAKVGSPWFDPARQAGALDYTNTTTAMPLSSPTANQIKKDWRAYGSLFQWQRNPDGHELINWTNTTSGTLKYGTIDTLSSSWTNPGHNNFIIGNSNSGRGWVDEALNSADTNMNLWQSGQSNNPCPVGYHVPTHDEQMALYDVILGYDTSTYGTINSEDMWNEQVLRLPANGGGDYAFATLKAQSSYGTLWSSSYATTETSYLLEFFSGQSNARENYVRGHSFGVRCIKDN
ncbi:hypothetical protein JSO54_10010, partial [Riemerella anatipestifer]